MVNLDNGFIKTLRKSYLHCNNCHYDLIYAQQGIYFGELLYIIVKDGLQYCVLFTSNISIIDIRQGRTYYFMETCCSVDYAVSDDGINFNWIISFLMVTRFFQHIQIT